MSIKPLQHLRPFRFIVFWLLCCLTWSDVGAQIPAPQLRCVRRDTLIWDLPTVACGTVNAYLIYAARTISGPYQLLATITNRNQTRYFHNNTDGGAWFYYMQTDATCAGQTRRSSDTLDNLPPALNPVLTVSVVNNTSVEVRWRKNPSPEVVGYIVYKQTSVGLVPIATVNNRDTLRYVDNNAQAGRQSETYQVLAVDACGNTSLFDRNHQTLLLRATQSKCNQSITLNWSTYRNWDNPTNRHEVWMSTNGRTAALIATVGAADSTYVIPNILDGNRYTVFVRAIQSVTNIGSRSNDTLIVADVINPVKQLAMINVTVNPNNTVTGTWLWNSNAKIDSVRVLKGINSLTFNEIQRIRPNYPLDEGGRFNDATVPTQPIYYKISTKDDCGAVVTSDYFSTLFLRAQAEPQSRNSLQWTGLDYPKGQIIGYQVFRQVNGITTEASPILPDTSRFFVENVAESEPEVCYRVAVRYRYPLPDSTFVEAVAHSNRVCVAQVANFWMPNAFTPGGANPEFKPVLTFGQNISSYQMTIYNRWGEKLFETQQAEQGWDGRHRNRDLPQGAYTYHVQLTQPNGQTIVKTGVLMLIR